ncbi:MAG: FxLYD domain-containing protein [Haloarculaceae archaeon]
MRRPLYFIVRFLRSFGLLYGGLLLITVGGSAFIYGIIVFYLAMPSTPAAGTTLAPVHSRVLPLASNALVWSVAVVGTASFAWEVRQNGLLNKDDRLLYERKKDLRREKADHSDAWQPPEEDREEESFYQELVDEGGLDLQGAELIAGDTPSVRGLIENTSLDPFEDVRVTVAFVGPDGDELDRGVATRKRIEGGNTWKFEVFYSGDDTVEGYRIATPEAERVT